MTQDTADVRKRGQEVMPNVLTNRGLPTERYPEFQAFWPKNPGPFPWQLVGHPDWLGSLSEPSAVK